MRGSSNGVRLLMSTLFLCFQAHSATAEFHPGDFVFITDDAVGVRSSTVWDGVTPEWTLHASGISYEVPELGVTWGLPSSVVHTPDGRLLVSTLGPDARVYDVTDGGTDVAHTPPLVWSPILSAGFGRMLADRQGRILVTVYTDGTVRDMTEGGYLPNLPVFASGLTSPFGLLETADGRILVTEEDAGEVTDITAGGDFAGVAPYASGLGAPTEIIQKPSGEIIVIGEQSLGAFRDISDGANPKSISVDLQSSPASSFQPLWTTGLICDDSNQMWVGVEENSFYGDGAEVIEVGGTRALLRDTKARQIIQIPSDRPTLERRDYAQPGDKLIGFDPATGLEWLAPSVTIDEPMIAFDIPWRELGKPPWEPPLPPPTNDYYALGWRHATQSELQDLFDRYAPAPGLLGAERDVAGLMEALGLTRFDPLNPAHFPFAGARGLVRNDAESWPGYFEFQLGEYSYLPISYPGGGWTEGVISRTWTSTPGFGGAGTTWWQPEYELWGNSSVTEVRAGHFLVRDIAVVPALDVATRSLAVIVLVLTGLAAVGVRRIA